MADAADHGGVHGRSEHQDQRGGWPNGYATGKKVKGGKRHALVDTDGRLIKLSAHPADIQDRDGGAALLRALRTSFPFV